jgi:hypothetical protein
LVFDIIPYSCSFKIREFDDEDDDSKEERKT